MNNKEQWKNVDQEKQISTYNCNLVDYTGKIFLIHTIG